MTFDPNPKPSKGRSRYPRWTLRDKTRVRLEDMTDKHVLGAIAWCVRTAKERYPDFTLSCYASLGLLADDVGGAISEEDMDAALEAEAEGNWEVCLHPMHEHLVIEAQRRGLEVTP